MSVIHDISKIGDNHLVTVIGTLSMTTPGLGIMLVFYPEAFVSLDIFKILLVTMSVGLLTALPIFLVVALMYHKVKAKAEAGIPLFVFAAIACSILAVVLQGIFWLYRWPLDVYVIFHGILFFAATPCFLLAIRLLRRAKH